MDRTDTLIKGLTGQYPAGTRSEHDLAALRDHAYTYVSYTPQGEFPFYVYYENIGKWMLNLPISFIHDDAMFFYFGWFGSRNEQQRIQSPEAFLQTLYEHRDPSALVREALPPRNAAAVFPPDAGGRRRAVRHVRVAC